MWPMMSKWAMFYIAEAKLVEQGSAGPIFRIACFSDAKPPNPLFDVPVEDFCVPENTDPPPATGTTDLQLMGRIMAMRNGFQYGSQYIAVARAGAPTAIQYSVDGGASWKWVSDLLAS